MPQHPQQSERGRASRPLPTARLLRGAALAASLAVLPLATACSGGGNDPAANSKPSQISAAPAAGVVAPAKVEVIADLTGCEPKIRVDAKELRQGVCHTPKADYSITTFPEEKYKETWLESASIYGGKYLVGARWVVAAKPKMLEQFRTKLGGNIRELSGLSGGPAPSAS